MPVLTIGDSLSEFEQREFALGSNDRVDEIRFQRLLGNQAGMPASENDRQVGPEFFTFFATRTADPIVGPVRTEMPET